jgi:hypothetical protein
MSINVVPATMPASAPKGSEIINSFEFEPSGTVFSQPISITFQFEPSQLPSGADSKKLALEYYNDETGKWEPCDYTLDVQNNLITASISHFSLYAIMVQGGGFLAGAGWNMTYLIILTEIVAGGLLLVLISLQRRRKPAHVPAAAAAVPVTVSPPETAKPEPATTKPTRIIRENATIAWNDILSENVNKGSSFKTQVEIIGGKVSIPQKDGLPLEIINTVDTRLIISLEFDPELHPKGNAKIIVLNAEQYNKSKEFIK